MTKKFCAILILLAVCLGLIPTMDTHAHAAVEAYDGVPIMPAQITSSNRASFGLTGGSLDGYYAIRNAKELYGFANLVNSGSSTAKGVLLPDIVVNTSVSASGAAYS